MAQGSAVALGQQIARVDVEGCKVLESLPDQEARLPHAHLRRPVVCAWITKIYIMLVPPRLFASAFGDLVGLGAESYAFQIMGGVATAPPSTADSQEAWAARERHCPTQSSIPKLAHRDDAFATAHFGAQQQR